MSARVEQVRCHINSVPCACFRDGCVCVPYVRAGLFMLGSMLNGVVIGFECSPALKSLYLTSQCGLGLTALLVPLTVSCSHAK